MTTFSAKSTTWEAPSELQRSTPREVTLTGKGRAGAIGAVLLMTAFIVTFVLMVSTASGDATRWAAWQAEAVSTSGQVVEAHKSGSGDDAKEIGRAHV